MTARPFLYHPFLFSSPPQATRGRTGGNPNQSTEKQGGNKKGGAVLLCRVILERKKGGKFKKCFSV
jgi:hypothetical protein